MFNKNRQHFLILTINLSDFCFHGCHHIVKVEKLFSKKIRSKEAITNHKTNAKQFTITIFLFGTIVSHIFCFPNARSKIAYVYNFFNAFLSFTLLITQLSFIIAWKTFSTSFFVQLSPKLILKRKWKCRKAVDTLCIRRYTTDDCSFFCGFKSLHLLHTQTNDDDWKNNKLVEGVVIPLDSKLPVEISFYPSFGEEKKE